MKLKLSSKSPLYNWGLMVLSFFIFDDLINNKFLVYKLCTGHVAKWVTQLIAIAHYNLILCLDSEIQGERVHSSHPKLRSNLQ